ncbi:unnamed protein product [Leptosia nina]|uniref:Peptidase S1 domain-containing protein n=1 Tax=Leptosia nina TaxID=320188 RepID=A0AAV1J057_9NEOP
MSFRVGFVALTLLAGSLAYPTAEDDMSIYFDHTNQNARIIGGQEAGTVPWMAALSNGFLVRNFVCGSSILTNRHLLSAAHCIQSLYDRSGLSRNLRATVGTNRWMYGGVHHDIARNITHPNYVHMAIKNDLTILITSSNIRFTSSVAPATLNFNEVGGDVQVTVHGWGHTRVNGAISGRLMELQTRTIDGPTCVREVPRIAQQFNMWVPKVEPHLEICALHSVNHGTCNGDSGSALIRSDNRQQIGVVSWGVPCARGAPDMFFLFDFYSNLKAANNALFKRLHIDYCDIGKCGRVVGGEDAAEGSVPYMAALVHGLMVAAFQCGGSLITTRHVLSAAHCFDRLYSNGELTPTLRVVVGTNRWNFGGQAYSIARNITHPKHIYIRDPLIVEYDIGLLVTRNEVILSDRVQLVPVSLDRVGAGVTGRVAGWGRIYHQGPLSPNLQELFVTTLEDDRCDRELRQASVDSGMVLPEYDPETEFCVFHSKYHGVCNGDSGSALVRPDTGEQFGIVSWGLPCARGAPDVFVRISGFKDWLKENLVL